MKFTKAEVEFIALENVDIVTVSIPSEQEIIDYCEKLGHGGWRNCTNPSKQQWIKIEEKFGPFGP